MHGMQLSDWYFDRLRRALNNYRIINAYDGHLLSWDGVTKDIVDSGHIATVEEEYKVTLSFKAEALRRFASRHNRLPIAKLEVLRRFLIEEELLGPTELEDGAADMRGLLVLASHLANDGEPVRRELMRIGWHHQARRTIGLTRTEIVLNKTFDGSGPYMLVDEEFNVIEAISPERQKHFAKDLRGGDIERRERRTGYAFLSTPANQLHIFLSGAAPDDRVTYLEMSPRREDSEYADMHLLRTGDFGKKSLGVLSDSDQQELYYWGGLLQFVPTRQL